MKNKISNLKNRLTGNSFLLMITVLLFVVMYVAGMIVFSNKGFAKPQMFLNLFISNAGLLVMAMGLTIVMIAGGIDISVGSVTALVCMVCANQMENHEASAGMAVVIAIAIGLAFGLVQGFLISYLDIQPFIITLAGIGGFLFCLNSCSGFVEQAKGMEMDAISSAVIGGTLLSGGVGTPFGTVFGVLIKGTISSLITTQGTLSSWWVRIVLSALLCFFIVLQSIFASMKKKG